jgi:hypothetical protein
MDAQLNRRPAGLKGPELATHVARCFIGQRCALGSSLVIPTMLLWHEFQRWAKENGEHACSAALRRLLDEAPWAEVVDRPEARGRFKSIVRGVGVRPSTAREDPPSGQ